MVLSVSSFLKLKSKDWVREHFSEITSTQKNPKSPDAQQNNVHN